MLDRKLIKTQAKNVLKNWQWFFVLIILVVIDLIGGATAGILLPILMYGFHLIALDLLSGGDININRFKEPFRDFNHAFKIFVVWFVVGLIVALGTVLLIVPGIIFALQYSQAVRLMYEYPDLKIGEALKKSKEMMKGYKGHLFCFVFSFFGHFLLGIITIGLWFLYLIPYYQVAATNYYLHLKSVHNVIDPKETIKEDAPVKEASDDQTGDKDVVIPEEVK